MKHALVVGGTGMLADVSIWLVNQGYQVSIIARNPARMNSLLERTNNKHNITPLLVDYKKDDALQAKVRAAIEKHGPIDLAIAWIHSNAPNALNVIVNEITEHQNDWDLFHVLGSSSNLEKIKKGIPAPEGCNYYQVQLGFVLEGEFSRWLSHKEISVGVIDAIRHRKKILTVGQLEPWEKRP